VGAIALPSGDEQIAPEIIRQNIPIPPIRWERT
jgi:hypothetical protein